MADLKTREHTQRSPNARLQDEIILYMYRHDVDTVSGLARELRVTRSSVSRAINALASGGFVSKDGEGWALTEVGQEEARELQERRSEQPERYEMRPLIEALNAFADSAKDLEQISEQLQLLAHVTEGEQRSPKEEVRHLQLIFDEVAEIVRPLEELSERMQPLLSRFDSPEEEAALPKLNAQDLRLLMDMARAFERATWLSERVSDGMNAITSLIDKMQSVPEEKQSALANGPEDGPHPVPRQPSTPKPRS